MASNHAAAKLLTVPANGQISIGKKWAGRQVRIEELGEGEIRIVSGTFVPDRNATFYTQEAEERLRDFDQWAAKNPPRSSDTQAILDRVEKKVRDKAKKRA